MNVPTDLQYSATHEWIRIDGNVATMGITDFAQSELGDIVYVDLPSVGRAVTAGQTMGTVESVKTVSDIYAPVSGTITEVNDSLGARSELVNSDPYGDGWMVKIQFDSAPEGLLSPAEYQAKL